MSISNISAEEFAKSFFHYHAVLGPDFVCSGKDEPQSWSDVPEAEKSRMIAAARLALLDLGQSGKADETDNGRYFAKPGSAEWGC